MQKLFHIIRLLAACTFFTFHFPVHAQFYSTGEPPSSLNWQVIQTDHFKLVFPSGFSDAVRMANLLESYFPYTMNEPGPPFRKKLPVLIHSSSVLSNGYLALAPRRMELVAAPPKDSYAQSWLNQLALHEFRHAVQLNRLNQGFTRAMGFVTGEISNGVVSSQIPSWFYEGDAVLNETRLSASGRGRVPGFDMPLRTLVAQQNRPFSYDKAIFGSFADYVPDHYQYGFQLVNYANETYGAGFWPTVLDFTARNPYMIWPLAIGMKKNYGIFKSELYHLAIDSIRHAAERQMKTSGCMAYEPVNPRRNTIYTSYIHPAEMSDQRTVCYRNGLNDPGSFVIISSEGEERIKRTGRIGSNRMDVHDDRLVWDEMVMDHRWPRRDYSVIRVMDLTDLKTRTITRKSRYFSPAFSPDGRFIAVVETDFENDNFLVVIGSDDGRIVQRIPAGKRELQTPEWISDQEISMITVTEQGKQIETVLLSNQQWKNVIPSTSKEINELLKYREFILFRGSFEGTDNIYAFHTGNRDIFRITSSCHGAYHPSVSTDSSDLLFSEYTGDGFNICRVKLDRTAWIPVDQRLLFNKPVPMLTDSLHQDQYPIKPYIKALHLFRLHSWLPFSTDISNWQNQEDLAIYPGVTLFSQNLLSTVTSSLSYSYNQGYHILKPTIAWRTWYPVIELSGHIGGSRLALGLSEGTPINKNAPYYKFSVRSYVPWVASMGATTATIQPEVMFERESIWNQSGSTLKSGISLLHYKLNVNVFQRMALRNLYPQWGQAVSVVYTHTPDANDLFGSLFAIQTVSFLPGMFSNHHFFIRAGFQVQQPERYYLPINKVTFPRGYQSTVSRKFSSIAFNYAFPVGYPDWSLGPLLYVKRLRANVFYDMSYGVAIRESGSEYGFTGFYRSFGLEAVSDVHVIRFIFPVSMGVRVSYIPDHQRAYAEMLININTGIF